MIDDSVAETKWCPFALTQSEVKECDFSGDWKDETSSYVQVSYTRQNYHTDGKVIAITVINRNADGTAHEDCLCVTTDCVWWRELGNGAGDCSKLGDNMQEFGEFSDSKMESQWCPMARPENEVVTRPWNGDISGCTNAISSANRVAGGIHPSSKCITKNCMAFNAGKADAGYCMAADKNMQR
jgi:hypothetical protein